MSTQDPAYTKLLAYGVLGLIMFLLSRTQLGYKTIYYILWLIILGLIVQNGAKVVKVLEPIARSTD